MMGKVEENKQQKQERLLDTAFELFTTKGLAKTSISDIVKNAGVAKGTFYLYFKDKYDIANKLIASKTATLFGQAFRAMETSGAETPEDKIITIMDYLLNELQKAHVLLRFINKNLSWGIFKNAIAKAEESGNGDCLRMFQSIFEPNPEEWETPEIMLYTIVELVGSSCYSVVLDKDPMTLEEYKPYLYRAVRAVVQSFHRET